MNLDTEYQRVKQLIKILDFDNLRQFVLKVDIPYSTLANGENKSGVVSSRVLAAIKKAFPNVSLDWIVLGAGLPLINAPVLPSQQNIVNGNGNIAHQSISDCSEQLQAKDLEIAKLKGQIELLKELLNNR